MKKKAYRGHLVSPLSSQDFLDIKDGMIAVDEDGNISFVGEFDQKFLTEYELVDFGKKLIMPGFVDLHIHLPQVTQTGRSGQHLLKWLEKYIFPAEAKFENIEYAEKIAHWFFDELLRNGTTTACVFTTIHKEATDVAFRVAESKGNRVVMGKVLMDVNSPLALTESVDSAVDQSIALCEKWHMKDDGRLRYAFTPRFAVTASKELLAATAKAWRMHEGSYIHTHLAESQGEIDFVKELFPQSRSYVDVYRDHELFGRNTIFAHAIHLDKSDMENLSQEGCSLAHCPSSNFFLKSGVFKFRQVVEAGINFGLGSDVAAGPQMSMFQVMKDANYIQPKDWLEPKELLYRSSLAGAEALDLGEITGSLAVGKEADFIVVDPTRRTAIADDMLEKETDDILSSLVFLGDDRSVVSTYIRGREVFSSLKNK